MAVGRELPGDEAFAVGRDRRAGGERLGERPGDRSVGSLFGDLARHASLLFRQELALAKAEMVQKGRELGRGTALLAVGGLVAFSGFLVLLGAAVAGLALVLPLWLAALAVGLAVLGTGGLLVYVGRAGADPGNLVPWRTIRTMKDNAAWAKDEIR